MPDNPTLIHLRRLRDRGDRAALAQVRRGLTGDRVGALRHLPGIWRENIATTEALACAAMLFALHPDEPSEGSLILPLAIERIAASTDSPSVLARFDALLGSSLDDLPTHLRRAVSLAKAHGYALDWTDVFSAIQMWEREDRRAVLNWAVVEPVGFESGNPRASGPPVEGSKSASRAALVSSWKRDTEAFLELLPELDTSDLAELRRGFGGQDIPVARVLRPFIRQPYLLADRGARAFATVALLYAVHPPPRRVSSSERSSDGSTLASALGVVAQRSDSVELRFAALLNCHIDDVLYDFRTRRGAELLHNAVTLVRSAGIALDWRRLLNDLPWWGKPTTEKAWARDFWKQPSPPKVKTITTKEADTP